MSALWLGVEAAKAEPSRGVSALQELRLANEWEIEFVVEKEIEMPEQLKDITLTCKDCGQNFIFSVRDQQYWSRQTDKNTGKPWEAPKRCYKCRQAKKQRNAEQARDAKEGR